MKKVLVTLDHEQVSSRFDLTPEVLIASVNENGLVEGQKTVVLPHPSGEELCHLILAESVSTVICGGIEEEFFEYLTWKKISVIDSVMATWKQALDLFCKGKLEPATIIRVEKTTGTMRKKPDQ